MPVDIHCEDCGKKADAHGWIPIDRYHSETASRLLCLGCLATRRSAGGQWRRNHRRDT